LNLHKPIDEAIKQSIGNQQRSQCFTISHKFHIGRSTHTGNYD
jgi:NAD(P)H-quinone oxidoreductase subunit K